MPNIPYPNVPSLPGVPSLPRKAGVNIVARTSLGLIQGTLWRALQVSDKWGIVDSKGAPLFDTNSSFITEAIGLQSSLSTVSLEFSANTSVSNFPVEQGKFATYNKVELPPELKVTLALTGSESDRAGLIATLVAAKESTELYTIFMPEVKFPSYTLQNYNFQRRSTQGANLLVVELSFLRVRQVSAQYTKSSKVDAPKDPAAAPPVDSGKVQPKTPDQSVLKAAANKVGL